MPSISGSERSQAARIGAHTKWARTDDRTAATAPARAALEKRFLDEAGGDPVRAEHLRKAHFARLALRSAQSRRKAKRLLADAATTDAEFTAGSDGP